MSLFNTLQSPSQHALPYYFSTTMKVLALFPLVSVFVVVSLFTRGGYAAGECETNPDDPSKVVYTIVVSQSGDGNFAKVQDAIDSIPWHNNRWIKIYLKPGIYIEQVQIPRHKHCIVLEGHDSADTHIAFDAHMRTDTSPTFTAFASNFVAKNITFKNSFNRYLLGSVYQEKTVLQAVAMRAYGDKFAFYDCQFIGFQDTLWDVQGRHFFKSCYIEGAIDFIWGDGQSVYQDCTINVTSHGFITAQGRSSATSPTGFVFRGGSIQGIDNKTYLGRAYGPYSRVIWYKTYIRNVVNPQGWTGGFYPASTRNFVYGEVGCTGAGSDISKRVRWMTRAKNIDMSQYTVNAFINQDGWLAKQPLY